MWGILSGSPFRCPKSKWFNCSKTNQVDILFGEISVRWQKHVDNYPFSNLHRWVVVSHIHFVGVSATTGRLRAPTHLQPWNIRKVRRQHKYFLYFLMQMCWAFLSSKTTTASKKKQEKDLNTKGIGNSLLGSYCHHLHCQCSPNQSVILCFFLNLTFDCTCSEVSACPAALRHLSHSHLVPSEKAVSVSAKCKHRNISKQHYWIQHMNWKIRRALPLPVSDTGVVDTSASSCCCLQTWVCLHRNHMCRSLSCRDRLYILHRIAASASYATERQNN